MEYVNITQLKLLHKSLNKITATCTALNTCKYKAKLNYTKAETRKLFLKKKNCKNVLILKHHAMYAFVKIYQILVFKTCMYLYEKNEHVQEKILVETMTVTCCATENRFLDERKTVL